MAYTEIQRTTEHVTGTVVIPNGESESDAFPSGGRRFIAIQVPTITSATLTFLVQIVPGGDFVPLYDDEGEVDTGEASTGGRTFVIPQLAAVYAFKVRSGTGGVPVSQGAARTLTISASGGKLG